MWKRAKRMNGQILEGLKFDFQDLIELFDFLDLCRGISGRGRNRSDVSCIADPDILVSLFQQSEMADCPYTGNSFADFYCVRAFAGRLFIFAICFG